MSKGWMARWIQVLKEEARNGFHPSLPKYGFGDPTSYGLIAKIVDAVSDCGAVRHGAECFNFYFPQELDQDFLVVWADGYKIPPQWRTLKEPELRTFLLEQAREGYSFPLNPVWPVRDQGWMEVLQALQQNEEAKANLKSWFPPDVLQRIEQLHAEYPGGFVVKPADSVPSTEVELSANTVPKARKGSNRRQSHYANDLRREIKTFSLDGTFADAEDSRDLANWGSNEVGKEHRARYRRIRVAIKVYADLQKAVAKDQAASQP